MQCRMLSNVLSTCSHYVPEVVKSSYVSGTLPSSGLRGKRKQTNKTTQKTGWFPPYNSVEHTRTELEQLARSCECEDCGFVQSVSRGGN